MSNTKTLRVGVLDPNDYNPNQMTEERLAELVTEIQHLERLPKPIVARANGKDRFTIIDGEHAWRAAQKAGLKQVNVEVIEADDFEARRQTYKRNQNGEHDSVLLGRMFEQMMKERALSQRALAEEITVSEGTVRNALMYAEAAQMRNSYAQDKGLDEAVVDSARKIAALSIRQLRYYVHLPPRFADRWLRCGGDLKTLVGVKTESELAESEAYNPDSHENIGNYYKMLEDMGLLEYVDNTVSFSQSVKTIEEWRKWETRWTYGINGNCLTIKSLRPYTKHYFKGVWYVKDSHFMDDALNVLVNTQTKPPSFHLTPEEFEAVIADCDLIGRESAHSFKGRLELAVMNKGGKQRPLGKESVRWELMGRAIDAEGPDYIRKSELLLEHKYLLWKASGDDAAKRLVAKKKYISGKGDIKDRIDGAIKDAEQEISQKAKDCQRLERYQSCSKLEMATSLAERLFGEAYKDNPEALRKAAARLSRLDKMEIFALDDFIRDEMGWRRWLETLKLLTEITGSG